MMMAAVVTVGVSSTLYAETVAATTQPVEQASDVSGEKQAGRVFGEPTERELPTVTVANLLKDVDTFDGKPLRIEGTVASVCTKKGCWLTLAEEKEAKESVFVKFTCPINGRLIPTEAAGKSAVVEGTVKVTTLSEAEARHYAEDAGASPEEVAKIVGPQKRITIASPAASVSGVAAAEQSDQ